MTRGLRHLLFALFAALIGLRSDRSASKCGDHFRRSFGCHGFRYTYSTRAAGYWHTEGISHHRIGYPDIEARARHVQTVGHQAGVRPVTADGRGGPTDPSNDEGATCPAMPNRIGALCRANCIERAARGGPVAKQARTGLPRWLLLPARTRLRNCARLRSHNEEHNIREDDQKVELGHRIATYSGPTVVVPDSK
jgi:hypothetical protein